MAEAVRLFRNLLRHDYKDFPTSTAWSSRSRIVIFQRHTAGKIDQHCDCAVGMFRAQYSLARPAILMEIICCFLQPVTLIGGCSDFPVTYPDWDTSLSQLLIERFRGALQSVFLTELFPSVILPDRIFVISQSVILIERFPRIPQLL